MSLHPDIAAVLGGEVAECVAHADCLPAMKAMPDNCIDSIVTDPPYGLEFMGKDWDHGVPGVPYWKEALRVAKPGAMLLAFGGTRTVHRLACAIEDAGWIIRDRMQWITGQGFPKNLDISKAIDKAAGAEREVVGRLESPCRSAGDVMQTGLCQAATVTAPATDAAKLWNGWGTALKPAHEPIIVAMKPCEGTFAANAEKWGVAGLWIDGGRVATGGEANPSIARRATARRTGNAPTYHGDADARKAMEAAGRICDQRDPEKYAAVHPSEQLGRWPANVILSHHPECVCRGSKKVKAGKSKLARTTPPPTARKPSRIGHAIQTARWGCFRGQEVAEYIRRMAEPLKAGAVGHGQTHLTKLRALTTPVPPPGSSTVPRPAEPSADAATITPRSSRWP